MDIGEDHSRREGIKRVKKKKKKNKDREEELGREIYIFFFFLRDIFIMSLI